MSHEAGSRSLKCALTAVGTAVSRIPKGMRSRADCFTRMLLDASISRPTTNWPRTPGGNLWSAGNGVERSRKRQTLRVGINPSVSGRQSGDGNSVGHKEVPCDPPTKDDAGGTPASEFIQAYRGVLRARRGRVLPVPPSCSRPVRAGADPAVSGASVYRPEARRQHRRATPFGVAVLLHQDSEAQLERRRDSLSQAAHSPPDVLSREEVERLIDSADSR